MMNKLILSSILFYASSVHAHNVWVTALAHLNSNETLHADLSYSHNYPHSESIVANRLHIFKSLPVINAKNQAANMRLLAGSDTI